MAFIREIKVTARSVIDDLDKNGLVTGEREENEEAGEGFLHERGGGSYLITYTAESENDRAVTDISVTADGRVTLTREGGVQSKMEFMRGEEYKTVYSVPPYSFDMTVVTKRVDVSLTREGGVLRLNYLMTIGGQSRAVRMTVTAEGVTDVGR